MSEEELVQDWISNMTLSELLEMLRLITEEIELRAMQLTES